MSALAARAPAPQESSAGRRFYDASFEAWVVKVFPGEFYVTNRTDEVLVTVLGSCVAACIRDPIAGIGGMNHFMLPHDQAGKWGADSQSARYGNFAMEKLVNELMKSGCSRDRLEIKVFGGGNVTDTRSLVGTQNADFVQRYLADEGLPCAAKDLGGKFPRRINYFPATGRVIRRLLTNTEAPTVRTEEDAYARRLVARPSSGDIELFE